MRRHMIRAVLTANLSLCAPVLRPQIRCLHATPPLLKKSKFNDDKGKKGKQKAIPEKDEMEEESTEDASVTVIEEDPLNLEGLKQQLKDSVAYFQKGAYAIKSGQSDPGLMRALNVELPDELGGKMNFSDIATVGPKPGEARSLLITVFDTQYTKHIVRAIAQTHPTLNPQPAPKNDMQLIIPLPPMTKQTRLDNQKKLKDLADKHKTIIQNIRQKHNKQIKAATKADPTIGEDIVKKVLKDVDKEIQKSFGEVTKIMDKVSEDIMAA